MTFLYPYFLLAFGVLLIPIIIHLFNFKRYKKVYFSNISLLKSVQLQSQKTSKLKHLLVLISRILALSMLVLAFAQPVLLQDANTTQKNDVAIYIDNSFSMANKNDKGQLFEQAKEAAIKLAEEFGHAYNFYLVTNDLEGKHTRELSLNELLIEIKNTTLSASSISLESVFSRISTFKDEPDVYLFSDLQKTFFKLNDLSQIGNTVLIAPITHHINHNLWIDSAWFNSFDRRPKTKETIAVKLKNEGKKRDFRLELKLNDNTVAFSEETIAEDAEKEVALNFSTMGLDEVLGTLTISEYENPNVLFDDSYYFAYQQENELNVTVVYQDEERFNAPLKKLFDLDSAVNASFMPQNQVDFSVLENSDLIIYHQLNSISSGLAEQSISYLEKGKTLVILPSTNIDVENYNRFYAKLNANLWANKTNNALKINKIDKNNPFFERVFLSTNQQMDLPVLPQSYLSKNRSNTIEEAIITFYNDAPFLSKLNVKNGKLFTFHAPLFYENYSFSNHALFVPIFLRIKELSSANQAIQHEIGTSVSIPYKQNDLPEEQTKIRIKNETTDFIPRISNSVFGRKIIIENEIKNAGFYQLNTNEKSKTLAFNFNRNESALDSYTVGEVSEILEKNSLNQFKIIEPNQLQNALKEYIQLNKGKALWFYFIFAALMLFLIEIVLIRLLK